MLFRPNTGDLFLEMKATWAFCFQRVDGLSHFPRKRALWEFLWGFLCVDERLTRQKKMLVIPLISSLILWLVCSKRNCNIFRLKLSSVILPDQPLCSVYSGFLSQTLHSINTHLWFLSFLLQASCFPHYFLHSKTPSHFLFKPLYIIWVLSKQPSFHEAVSDPTEGKYYVLPQKDNTHIYILLWLYRFKCYYQEAV